MKTTNLISILTLILPSTSLFILAPLYFEPDASGNFAGTNLTAAITAYPSVQWQLIINPDSGPGSTTYPAANYIKALSALNRFPNVKTLGYVDTNYTKRALSAVYNDINIYANWANYPSANISISGIFFDDATTAATTAAYAYMHNVSDHAYATVPSDVTPVVFNPGTLAPTKYFSYADTIVEFENSYANYKNQSTIDTFPPGYLGQSAIIVYSTPSAAPVPNLVHNMIRNKIGAVWFGLDCCYNTTLDGGFLKELAGAVAAG